MCCQTFCGIVIIRSEAELSILSVRNTMNKYMYVYRTLAIYIFGQWHWTHTHAVTLNVYSPMQPFECKKLNLAIVNHLFLLN